MHAPLAPPRALNASADASSAIAWSSSESTGDSKTVISPITSGSTRLVARAVVPQADGLVVDRRLRASSSLAGLFGGRRHRRRRRRRRHRTPRRRATATRPPRASRAKFFDIAGFPLSDRGPIHLQDSARTVSRLAPGGTAPCELDASRAKPLHILAVSHHPNIRVERDGPVATVTIDRPESKNACTGDMWVALGATFRDLAYSGARVVLLTGAGGEFCAGADLTPAPSRGERRRWIGAARHDGRRDARARRRRARRPRLPDPGRRQGRRRLRRRRARARARGRHDLVLRPRPLLGDLRQARAQHGLRLVVVAAPADRGATRRRSSPSPRRC